MIEPKEKLGHLRKRKDSFMAKNSLVENINARKKSGKSRSKKNSTVSPRAYKDMKAGWPNSKKNKAKKK